MALTFPHRWSLRTYLAYRRLRYGLTLGVRAMLLKDGAVTLVKHTYVPGWHMPGGGVEPGETVAEAIEREVREETGMALTAPAALFGIYRHSHADARDHVSLFVCREFERQETLKFPNLEIVACETFPVDRLPDDATASTRARLDEVLGGKPPAADW